MHFYCGLLYSRVVYYIRWMPESLLYRVYARNKTTLGIHDYAFLYISIVLDLKILSLYLNYLEFLMNSLIRWRSAIGYSNVTFSINQSCLTITCLSRLHNKCVDTPVESPSCWWDKLKLDKIEHFLPSQHFFFIS